MKLRNKKTGEIRELPDGFFCGDNLKKICKEWEDYEEPKEYWFVSCDGRALKATTDDDDYNERHNTGHKEIGNYFSSREEAELAVRKLKALTEAKKDGLKIKGYYYNHEDLVILADIGKCNKFTLDTLFGKEID